MKLEGCVLDIDGVHMSDPLLREPEQDWNAAYGDHLIPDSLFKFYSNANYFALDRIPRYLSEEDGKLYFYLKYLVHGIKDLLVNIPDSIDQIQKYLEMQYDPLKKLRNEEWDDYAPIQKKRTFKILIIDLYGSLDIFSEIVAIFLSDIIPQLVVGRASITKLKKFADNSFPEPSGIINPKTKYAEEMHIFLKNHLIGEGTEKSWFELLKLYRNKIAHLGNQIFHEYIFQSKDSEQFYTFLPRVFPITEESKISETESKLLDESFPEYFSRILNHNDICSYSRGLYAKVVEFLDAGFEIMIQIYNETSNFEPNSEILQSLARNSEEYEFLHFENP